MNYLNKIYRALDANLNRAREGMRVIEEVIRFVLEEKELLEEIKKIRHELSLVNFPVNLLLDSRDADHDVGKELDITMKMHSIGDIVTINARRVQEALRVIEEFSKLLNNEEVPSIKIKNIRYKIYSIERKLISQLSSSGENTD